MAEPTEKAKALLDALGRCVRASVVPPDYSSAWGAPEAMIDPASALPLIEAALAEAEERGARRVLDEALNSGDGSYRP